MIRGDGKTMIENIAGRAGAGQIEEAVIGEIDDRGAIGPRRHVEREFHRPGQAPGHLDLQHAGIALFTIGAGTRKGYCRTRALLDPDNPPVVAIETLGPAMQRIGPVIGRELHHGAVEREARARNTIGIASDGRAKILPPGNISIERVMTEHDVVAAAGGIRHQQRLQRRAIGDDAGLESTNRLQGDALYVGTIRQHPETGAQHAGSR